MSDQYNNLYQEKPEIGNLYREKQKAEFDLLIERLRISAEEQRRAFFRPDTTSVSAYENDIENYRRKFRAMLGWPLNVPSHSLPVPKAEVVFVAEDGLGKIFRVEVEAGDQLTAYGLLFLPHGEGPHPLVISQHGGQGTPELCSGLYGQTNYNDMTRRILSRGMAVFAPQLLLWNQEDYGPKYDRINMDKQLKQIGSSIAALEIYKIQKCLDYLLSRDDINAAKVGMIGLSYGGFYTLFATAVDTRIKAAYSSCFINDRFVYDWPDFTWFNSGNTFLDAEVCGLICPRVLHIEVGKNDDLFDYKHAIKEMDKVAALYDQLNVGDRLSREIFHGSHELDVNDKAIDWFCLAVRSIGENPGSDFR
ncbi:alpha/beta hydrolase family protein [Cohnella silvisoli]|uniref:Dienelactone hydrolase family protein n=1 Tax=Cohnella silvisoli TaxID=2873699 RepID=A0ABV1L265_9BACL|nr:dienelactone hydrolase family protein [Cohnella silvisoli]MCD9025784.1 dienelactone hydrolase family protein [Cohnella silvisoli]